MTKKKQFENCGRTEGRKDGRTTDATPWHKLIGSFGPDELKTNQTSFVYEVIKLLHEGSFKECIAFNRCPFQVQQVLYVSQYSNVINGTPCNIYIYIVTKVCIFFCLYISL